MQFILNIFTFIYLFILSFMPVSSWSQGLQGQPLSFIPFKASTDAELTVSSLIFRRLATVDPMTGNIQYDLLESYDVKEEGLVYEIKMKEGQYWQDGVEITSNDLLYTASLSGNLREVSSDRIDKYRVRFVLPNKYSPFLSIISIPLLPAHLQDSNKDLRPVGSGDYRVVRINKDRAYIEEVVLATSNKDLPFQKITFKFYDSSDELRIALKLKEIKGVLFDKSEAFEGYNSANYTFAGRSYLIVFDTNKEKLSKENRRQLASAIDYSTLISEQEYAEALRPSGPFSGTWAASDSYEQILYDPNAQLTGIESLKILIPNVNEARLISEQLKISLESHGVGNVEIQAIPTKDYVIEARKINYDIILLAQEYGTDPDRYIFWHGDQNETGLNFSNLANLRIDRSLEEGREAQDIETRKEHYNIFQSVFSEEAPAVYLLHPTYHFYYSEEVESIPDDSLFYPWQIFRDISSWKLTDPKLL